MSASADGWVIIGAGNEMRGDDAAGIAAMRELARMAPGAKAIEASGDGAELIELFSGADRVIVFDAALADGAPGTIHRFDASDEAIPADLFHYSTHAFSLPQAVEMARVLGQLPEVLIVYAIEGGVWNAGAALSPEVEKAVREAAARALADIQDGACAGQSAGSAQA